MSKNVIGLFFVTLLIGLLCFAYLIGGFLNSFDTNMCYSEVFHEIQLSVDYAVQSGEKSDIEFVGELMKVLPFSGYESDCDKIREAAQDFRKKL